ncbi:extracellular solute-binding protein [Paenibacillus vulneris]|uniref:Extracellular solute-binding protein n=1 Tax=Paenibacillus vulneris TaxID=1133364 RepID=A0ABW3US25_9BACL
MTVSLLSMLSLEACSGSKGMEAVQNKSNEDKKLNEPVKITVMAPFISAEPIKKENPGLKKLEELTNSNLEINWVPISAYNDKVNVTIASNNLPNALVIYDNKAPSIINSARSGMFWEIGPYLKDYKNLSKINSVALNNISVDGKIYSLPRERPLARNGIIFRKDWLDQLGLSEPKNVDDIYEILKAFTNQDPDKNGKNDTYGLTESKDFRAFDVMLAYLGGSNGWEAKDSRLTPSFMTKEYLDTMKFFKRLYDEKLMNQDFLIANAQIKTDNINNGKAGVYMDYAASSLNHKFDALYKANPKADLDVVTRINGTKGVRILSTSGYLGTIAFPKTSVKTEGELKQILSFFDNLYEDNIQELVLYGIKGTHYTDENGKKAISPQQQQLYSKEISDIAQMFPMVSDQPKDGVLPVMVKAINMEHDNLSIIINNPTEPLISNTYTEKGTELDKIILDARAKFIMGKIDEAKWNSEIEQWKNSGGNKIIEEYSTEYNKMLSK